MLAIRQLSEWERGSRLPLTRQPSPVRELGTKSVVFTELLHLAKPRERHGFKEPLAIPAFIKEIACPLTEKAEYVSQSSLTRQPPAADVDKALVY